MLFAVNYVPIYVGYNTSTSKYSFSQFGSNNPTLTCYRGTNYNFIVDGNVNLPNIAIRNDINDTSTQVVSTFNNDIVSGKRGAIIYFTPVTDTPNTIYYQSVLSNTTSGTIVIKNYE